MQVNEIMTRDVECARPDTTLQQAALKMQSLNVGSLPVCENDQVIGMITDRDITIRATAEGRDPKDMRVREVMTENVVFCFEDQQVGQAAEIMREHQIRRLPVLNHNRKLVGIVSLGDIVVETGNDPLSGHTLERISEPAGTY